MSRKTAAGRVLREMDPNEIYFTHARVRPVFTGCNKRIQDTLDEIVAGTTTLADIPYITVIENFETPKDDGDSGNDEEDSDQDNGRRRKRGPTRSANKNGSRANSSKRTGKGATASREEPQPFYFSLNNRRLFLFKTLKRMGLVDKVTVQVKPALERERAKYTRDRCVLEAKLMGAGAKLNGHGSDRDGQEESEEMDMDDSGARTDRHAEENVAVDGQN